MKLEFSPIVVFGSQGLQICLENVLWNCAGKSLSFSFFHHYTMPSALIRQVADYCWSNNFLDVFHKFFKDHAEAFVDAPEMTGGEHNMEYYRLFEL